MLDSSTQYAESKKNVFHRKIHHRKTNWCFCLALELRLVVLGVFKTMTLPRRYQNIAPLWRWSWISWMLLLRLAGQMMDDNNGTLTVAGFVPSTTTIPLTRGRSSPHSKMGPFLSTFGTSGLATSSSMPTKSLLRAGAFPLMRAATSPHLSFFLTRIVLLRGMAFVYMVAFWIAFQQNKGLIGDTGIAPARAVLDAAQNRGVQNRKRREEWLRLQMQNPCNNSNEQSSRTRAAPSAVKTTLASTRRIKLFLRRQTMTLQLHPTIQKWRELLYDRQNGRQRPVSTIFWIAKDRSKLNPWLDRVALLGFFLSIATLVTGSSNVPILLVMWICQRSLMAVGGPFYAYGWEPQLAELNFHMLFLVPLISLNPLGATCPPSPIVMFTIRWYLCRIMLGAGLIKIKSRDPKWRWPQLNAMDYFYETQPIPNPLSKYFHWMPHWFHRGEVMVNHFVELIAPILLLFPFISTRRWGGIIQIAFQAVLVTSGNLSFLNWLTAVPAIACLDDGILGPLFFSQSWQKMAVQAASLSPQYYTRSACSVLFGILIAFLSIPVIRNLLSRKQLMNGSFGPWGLVNTYGAFGNVNEERDELIISATTSVDAPWKEYEFKAKPGNVHRYPIFLSPFHLRLDWQMWIASLMGSIDRSPWVYTLLYRILQKDLEIMKLLANDPFSEGEERPRYIRIDRYRYSFSREGKKRYWDREMVGRVYPKQGVASAEDLEALIELSSN